MTHKSEIKKQDILDSALRVFFRKGFAKATMAEIAKGAGLTGSGIYNYFQGKEALLFTIIENFLVKSRTELRSHLQGISGADNKLRKAIWYHCTAYSSSKKEIKIVLEARSYPRFYQSSAYVALKRYARIITKIIEEGIAEGEFAGISSPMILRAISASTDRPLQFSERSKAYFASFRAIACKQ